jgi:hypothetical protein
MEEMRVERSKRNRRQTGPGTWERIPGYELPDELQLEALTKRFGEGVIEDAATSMRTGNVTVAKDAARGK